VHVRADRVRDRVVPHRVGLGRGHGGGQRDVQHAGRAGVRGSGGQPSRPDRQVAAAPGQRRLRDVLGRSGRLRRGQRDRVVRGGRHGRHVRRLLFALVHAGQARGDRRGVDEFVSPP